MMRVGGLERAFEEGTRTKFRVFRRRRPSGRLSALPRQGKRIVQMTQANVCRFKVVAYKRLSGSNNDRELQLCITFSAHGVQKFLRLFPRVCENLDLRTLPPSSTTMGPRYVVATYGSCRKTIARLVSSDHANTTQQCGQHAVKASPAVDINTS
jgi:hypothetical protein